MRRFFMGMAIASLTVASPIAAQAGDREIADTIVQTLKSRQTDGSLKDFDIDLSVEAGVVTLSGSVANAKQAAAVVEASRGTAGVIEIINEIEVREKVSNPVATATKAAEQTTAPESYVQPAGGELPIPAPTLAEPPAMSSVAPGVAPADAQITDSILSKLATYKNEGTLRNFELDISTVRGEVGHAATLQPQSKKNWCYPPFSMRAV